MTGSAALFAALYPGLFSTPESLQSMSETLNSPVMVAMMGPVYGLSNITTAIAMAQECLIWFAIAVIVMNIFFVNRHTRVDEELGRHEMILSLRVGRLTGSTATLFSAFMLNVLISISSALVIILLNIDGTTILGAVCYAFSIGLQGFLFAAVTLLTAQLCSTARGSMSVSFGLMGLFYIMRAYGDISGNAFSYISPMGIGLKVEAFYSDAYWPCIVLLAEALVIAAIALKLNTIRDLGAGIFPARKGRSRASVFLKNPLGLFWRLSKSSFIGWGITFFILGLCYGSIIGELESFIENNNTLKQMLQATGGSQTAYIDAFLPMLCGIIAMLISIPVINTINLVTHEEKRGRMEQIYARVVSHSSVFLSSILIAVFETILFMLLSMTGFYMASVNTGLVSLETIIHASSVQIPAVLVMSAIAALLVGVLPKLTALIWVLFAYSFLILYFGGLFDLPEWVTRISPFGNIPQIPVEEFTPAPVVILCIITGILYAFGHKGYKERDIRA
jgi:ABC-2 type transport system permease protein